MSRSGKNLADNRASSPDIERTLPDETVALLKKTGSLAADSGFRAYLVGGLVRDMFLGVGSLDLDVAVEGDGPVFARRLGKALDGEVTSYERFMTATLTMPDMTRMDIASARSETYARPGALPDVKAAGIGHDLMRRDFTVNAMAIELNPDRFGELVDPYGGAADLAARVLRVLHPRSFADDPTRIIRLSRFAARFDFIVETETAMLLEEALASSVFDTISSERLKAELSLSLCEPDPAEAFLKLEELGVLAEVLPEAGMGKDIGELMDQAGSLLSLVEKGPGLDRALIGFLLLLRDADAVAVRRVVRRMKFSGDAAAALKFAPRLRDLSRKAEKAASPGSLHAAVEGIPLPVLLAVLVLVGTEEARRRLFEYMRRGRNTRPRLTGDDLMDMGYASGPGLKRILDALVRARLDGEVKSRKQEEAFVREHFSPPDGEASA